MNSSPSVCPTRETAGRFIPARTLVPDPSVGTPPSDTPQLEALEVRNSPRGERVVIEADEITFRVGDAVLSLTRANGGTLEIRAPNIRLVGIEVISEADGTNAIVGRHVVTEAKLHNDQLGKLIRIDGQCVNINQ